MAGAIGAHGFAGSIPVRPAQFIWQPYLWPARRNVGRIFQKQRTMSIFTDNNEQRAAGFRRFMIRLAFLAFVMLVWLAKCHCQPAEMHFQSFFQIRYALPDTVQLLHIPYNVTVSKIGVQSVPINGSGQTTIPVQNWIAGDAGEWIGVTKSGATVTVYGQGPTMYLEIKTENNVLDMYNGCPQVLTWKDRTKL